MIFETGNTKYTKIIMVDHVKVETVHARSNVFYKFKLPIFQRYNFCRKGDENQLAGNFRSKIAPSGLVNSTERERV